MNVLLIGLLTISGNQVMPDLREAEPVATYSAADFGHCVVNSFSSIGRVAILRRGERSTLSFDKAGPMQMIVDIERGRATIWTAFTFDGDAQRKIKGCL